MSLASCNLPRMQVNSVWISPPIQLATGTPPLPVDATGWTVAAEAKGELGAVMLNIDNGKLAWLDASRFTLTLAEADCALLGEGLVQIEIVRLSPAPAPQSLGRIVLSNHDGIYQP